MGLLLKPRAYNFSAQKEAIKTSVFRFFNSLASATQGRSFSEENSTLSILKLKQYIWQVIFYASVAQLDRAPDFGSGG